MAKRLRAIAGVYVFPISLVAILAGANAIKVKADGGCDKCCGGGELYTVQFGHRDCSDPVSPYNCHVSLCPEHTSGTSWCTCQYGEGDRYNDYCAGNNSDPGWECTEYGLHWCSSDL